MKNLLDDYVYRNLRVYGNAYINETTFEKHGESKILADLKEHGFDCELRIYEHFDEKFIDNESHKPTFSKNIIIQVK